MHGGVIWRNWVNSIKVKKNLRRFFGRHCWG
jgi:hypothetical protein